MQTDSGYRPTYWESKGELQEIYSALMKVLVPSVGDAPTEHSEALRWISNIYYEVYNNGGCNAVDREDGSLRLTKRYAKGVEVVAEFAGLTDPEARTLRRSLRCGDGLCDGSRPLTAKGLDAIVTKVVKAVTLAHLMSLPSLR